MKKILLFITALAFTNTHTPYAVNRLDTAESTMQVLIKQWKHLPLAKQIAAAKAELQQRRKEGKENTSVGNTVTSTLEGYIERLERKLVDQKQKYTITQYQ